MRGAFPPRRVEDCSFHPHMQGEEQLVPPPVQPCTTASCAGNAARPSHPARVLIGEQERVPGDGESSESARHGCLH